MNSPFGESTFHCFCARFGDEEMILARNIDYRSISQKKIEAIFGPATSKDESRDKRAIVIASQFAYEFVYVSPKYVLVWLFTVETLSFFSEI